MLIEIGETQPMAVPIHKKQNKNRRQFLNGILQTNAYTNSEQDKTNTGEAQALYCEQPTLDVRVLVGMNPKHYVVANQTLPQSAPNSAWQQSLRLYLKNLLNLW
jgi:hypothetical protein